MPKAAHMAKMLARTGFVVAFLLGLGALLGVYADVGAVLWLHIAFGLVFLVGAWLVTTEPAPRRRLTQFGAGLGTVGALLIVGRSLFWHGLSPWWHIVAMVLAVGLLEMGAARARRS